MARQGVPLHVRIDEDLGRRLERFLKAEKVSKTEVVAEGLERVITEKTPVGRPSTSAKLRELDDRMGRVEKILEGLAT